jgi:hypothetical protein
MIKPVETIPMNATAKRQSYRGMIRGDIEDAIAQGITKFEFAGDYNWKYLAQYAREEADTIWRKAYAQIMREAGEEHGIKISSYLPSYKDKGQYIKIHSVKMTDRIHVYCEIDPDAPMRICQPLIDEAIKEHEERQAGIEAKDLNMDIYDVELSARSAVTLKRAGIEKVGDLRGKKKTDLIKIRNLGRKSADEVWALMQKFGIAEDEDGQTV